MSVRHLFNVQEVANPAEVMQRNMELVEEWLFRATPSKRSSVETTLKGPPTDGAWQVSELWVDAILGVWRCTVAGEPGTWIQVAPALVAANPTGIVTGYWIIRSDLDYAQYVYNGSSWDAVGGGGAVTSVAGRVGDVVLTTADLGDMTAAGVALATGSDAAAQRTSLGLGTAAVKNVPASGDAASGEVVKGDDTRLTNSRTPTSHTHPSTDISDSTAAGRALLTGTDASAQRASLGLGSLATQSGTFSGTSSGTNTGDQTITLTGGATGSGTGSFAVKVKYAEEDFKLTGIISPTALSGNTDNWNPTSLSTASVIRISSSAAYDLTGLQGGADGRLIFIHNVGSYTITLKNESGSSTAAYRFELTADLSLVSKMLICLQYDGTSSRWRLLGDGGGSSSGSTLESIWVPAGAMIPQTTNGAQWGITELASTKPTIQTLDFDSATAEYANFSLRMPKRWNASTVTVAFTWKCSNANTNSVVWAAATLAIRDGDDLSAVFGTAQTVTDAHSNSTTKVNISAATSAITAAGTTGSECQLYFRIYRDATNGSDTVAQDAQLLGVTVYYTATTNTDA